MDWSKAKRSSISAGSFKNPATPVSYDNYNASQYTSQLHPSQQQPSLPSRSGYYETHWPLFNADWMQCSVTGNDLVALSTYREDSINKIEIIEGTKSLVEHPNGLTSEGLDWQKKCDLNVCLPVSKLLWDPEGTERLITTSDRVSLYDYDGATGQLIERLSLVNGSSSSANYSGRTSYPPLTSFDWNKCSNNIVLTSSIDTTCTVWDLNHVSSPKTQLIAHDSEVFDVQFIKNSKDIFASVGADGSMRVFDLRCLDHSTIIYEPSCTNTTPPPSSSSMAPSSTSASGSASISAQQQQQDAITPLLRLSASQVDPYILATIPSRSSSIPILDMRYPGTPLIILQGHQGAVNAIKWHPSKQRLVSAGDDCQVLVWDVNTGSLSSSSSSGGSEPGAKSASTVNSGRVEDCPAFAYGDGMTEFNGVAWGRGGEWVGVVGGKGFQGVRCA